MTRHHNDTQEELESQVSFEAMLRDPLQQAVRTALIAVVEAEVDAFIGAVRSERSEQRRDYRNGHYNRSLQTSIGPIEDLPVPRTRGGFQTQLFERYHRRRSDLDQSIGQMFLNGVSMQRVGEVVETLTGSKPSASTISRVFHSLESEDEQWKQRKLAERYVYAFADGTYFTVIYNGEGCKMPILAVVGIAESGERDVLAFCVGDRENEQAWQDLLTDLKERGVKAIDLWISDGNQAMLNAITKQFPDSASLRCVVHKMDNVLSYVPSKQQEQLKAELKALFYQKDRQAADQAVAAFIEKYERLYPGAVACLKRDLEACLTFYAYPKEHWKTSRTNNVIERLFGQVKRRSHKIPRDAQRVAPLKRSGLRALKNALLGSEGRGISDPWSEKGTSTERACEGTSAECATRCALRGKWRRPFAMKGVVSYCFTRSFAVCASTN
jgi:putative transposase